MVEITYCDVCGAELERFRDSKVFIHLEPDNPESVKMYYADLCVKHGDVVRELIEQMKEEHNDE